MNKSQKSSTKAVPSLGSFPRCYQDAAIRVIEDVGILNNFSDEFSNIFERLMKQAPHADRTKCFKLIRQAIGDDGTRQLGLQFESAATGALTEAANAGYLLGLAVGLQMAGAR